MLSSPKRALTPPLQMIILIRHAQSEGNKNREIHQLIPDHRVKLTDLGWNQVIQHPYPDKSATFPPNTSKQPN